jgi:hypothetical protein
LFLITGISYPAASLCGDEIALDFVGILDTSDFEATPTQVPDAENYVSAVSIAESAYQAPQSG